MADTAAAIARLQAQIEHQRREFAGMTLGPRADAQWVRERAIGALGIIGAFAQTVADEHDGTADRVRRLGAQDDAIWRQVQRDAENKPYRVPEG